MNNQKSKSKKRKLSDLDESSGDDSNDTTENLASETEEGESENEDGSSSNASSSSIVSLSLTKKAARRAKGKKVVINLLVSDSSESEESESSSSGIKSSRKRKPGPRALSSSSSDSESQSSSDSNIKGCRRRRSGLLSDSSDSSDDSCEKCAICLHSIKRQEVGSPEVCDHLFCSVCIIEWSKNSNVCPLDRQQFSIILVRENKDATVVRKVSVEPEPQTNRVEDVELEGLDDTVCEICGSGDREDILLLCDTCDRGFHTVCLTPPLENIPDENEWFCPDCYYTASAEEIGFRDFVDLPSNPRSLRPRVSMVRTRLLERIRVAVNRIVDNLVPEDTDDSDSSYEEFDSESKTSESESVIVEDLPGPSGIRPARSNARKTTTRRRKKKVRKTKRSSTSTKRKRKTTTTTTKRKTTTGKRKTRRRTRRVKTTRTKKVKVENPDGTITEKIVRTRTYKRRRKHKTKKPKLKAAGARRGLRVKSSTTPKTVKGRLALTLGMVPPKKPGQLLPDVKVRPPNSHITAIDLNRARAGIPKLHIFGPRDELQYYSSGSDHEDFIGGSSGGVATVVQQRTNISRLRDRKKAALVLQSTPVTASKPKPVIEAPAVGECMDILGSILDSQAIWHSKNTNVKIKEDGSIEVIKDNKPESGKKIDVREGKAEGATTQAPMYPGTGSRPGGFRPYNRTSYGETRSGQESAFAPRTGQSSTGVSFNRFGGPARNESYTNYLNNVPQGPTPFCRGGPPLRFRMPARQQLRRITFPARNRPAWQPEEEEENDEEKKDEGEEEKKEGEEETQAKQQEDEDIDLYSDIETNVEKEENSGTEEGGTSYPALGPPPEPPAFLLGLDENGEFGVTETTDKSEVYDPAEPCDSEEEMVIDENKEQTPERKEPEEKPSSPTQDTSKSQPLPAEASPKPPQKASSEDDDEDCPIFSIYSSATREFSQKEEDERQREIEEDRKKLEEIKLQTEKSETAMTTTTTTEDVPTEEGEKVEKVEKVETVETLEKSGEIEEIEKTLNKEEEKILSQEETTPNIRQSRSRSKSTEKAKEERSPSSESEKAQRSGSEKSSSSPERKYTRSSKRDFDTDSDGDAKKIGSDKEDDDEDKENEERVEVGTEEKDEEEAEEDDKAEKTVESETEVSQKFATGLEGLEVEEVSSDNGDGAEFGDKRSLSSLSLSDLSHGSKRSPVQMKKKKKNKKRKSKSGKNYEEGEIDDSEKDNNRLEESFDAGKNEEGNENAEAKTGGEKKRRKSDSGSERQILGSKENKKVTKEKTSKDKDLSWKKPSKKEKNYREGKKRSKERGRSRSPDRRKSRSPSPKKDKKKSKDRKKKTDKKKDIERYDVRKIVKNKEVRKTDAFGRDIVSKSRSISISRSRSPIRERSRNMLRRDSRSYSRSRSRSFRRGGGGGGRSPIRRRYLRSRTRSRSKSPRRSYSRSRSRSRSRKTKKKPKSKDRTKLRSRSRGRKSRSVSRGRRRSPTKSRSRTPIGRLVRGKKSGRSRRSWSHHMSRSPSFSPRRSRSVTRSPLRVRRSYSRSMSTSWSRGRSPLPRTSSLEKLTVVLTTKDKKKWKKKKEGRKSKKEEKRRKKGGGGNSKEVFASGDNVLVSVNFRNNNNSTGNNSGSLISTEGRNARLNSLSPPVPATKKKKGSDYEGERGAKKSKKSNPISKKAVDVALSNTCPKRAKKLTRLSEKDAEVILNRKPVAVIDLDMSPYREQTPSPVNVVVVSDSGSGDEGKEHTPARGVVAVEPEKMQETGGSQQVSVSAPSSPLENGYVPTSGPKTPPEPQIKFSINKPQQLRQIANPLGDDDDDEDEAEEEEGEQRMESLDRRIEKELNPASHKGPNTPPAPRGPSTPKTPPSPQTSPDAYDPFEPTKSRSPSPSQADKENRPSPKADGKEDQPPAGVTIEGANTLAPAVEAAEKAPETNAETLEDKAETEKSEAIPAVDCSSNAVIPSQTTGGVPAPEVIAESPIAVVITTPQSKTPTAAAQKAYPPVMKQLPVVSSAEDAFSMPSPTKTSRSSAATTTTTTTTTQTLQQMTGIQRLQHRLGSPVNRTPNSVKSTPEKRATPRTDTNEIFSSGNYKIRNASKRNGEQPKQPRPLQDATNETIDITTDMDDSPYSPASSEGDDLFDPPVETAKPSQSNSKAAPSYKSGQKPPHKSPVKQLSKFDLLFGPSGPTLSPLKVGNKKANAKPPTKTPTAPKVLLPKPQKKAAAKKNVMHKMDEDQLRILDELPSSAVELQVKDKFLKKLNRQERVVDEVKTVLKPHYARKHITKEEYKDILRRSVPKICHSRSGEINPSKIQSLIEAYVRKFRHAKKKGLNAVTATAAAKPKVKKTMFS